MFNENNHDVLEWSLNGKTLRIIPWGHGLRVCDSFGNVEHNWALTETVDKQDNFLIEYDNDKAKITNGKTAAIVDNDGKIIFYNQTSKVLLEEFWRFRKKDIKRVNSSTFVDENMLNNFVSALKIAGR